MAKKLPIEPAKIEAVRRKDTRKNIPNEKLRGFVSEEENKPKRVFSLRDSRPMGGASTCR